MKKINIAIIAILLLLFQIAAVSAMTASDAREEWQDAKDASKDAREAYTDARVDFVADNSDENEQALIEAGKDSLNAALDEAEAWLVWKDLEAQDNDDLPEEMKENIQEDVDKNIAKIEDLREKVDNIQTRIELGVVFIEMIGKYVELLTDVARNSGLVWVFIADEKADTIEGYEEKLRDAAQDMDDNEDILEYLDDAKAELEIARSNIDNAESTYYQVTTPGTPLMKFAEANNYLRSAKINLINAHRNLNQAFIAMSS